MADAIGWAWAGHMTDGCSQLQELFVEVQVGGLSSHSYRAPRLGHRKGMARVCQQPGLELELQLALPEWQAPMTEHTQMADG